MTIVKTSIPVGQGLDFQMLFLVDGLVALDKWEVGLGGDVGWAAISQEVVNALLCYAILEWAHALHHLTFDLGGAVNVIGGQEMLRDCEEKETKQREKNE